MEPLAASQPARRPASTLACWVVAVRPRLRAATHREYARHVAQYWIPAVGRIALTRLTPGHVERTMADLLERGLSPLDRPRCAHDASKGAPRRAARRPPDNDRSRRAYPPPEGTTPPTAGAGRGPRREPVPHHPGAPTPTLAARPTP